MIGKYLKMIRAATGKRTKEFVKILETSASHYSQVETCHVVPARATLKKWAGRLGVSPAALELLALEVPREIEGDEFKVAVIDNLKLDLLRTLALRYEDGGVQKVALVKVGE